MRNEMVSKQTTRVTAVSSKLEWQIDQFEKLMKLFKNGQNLVSRQFSCSQAPTIIWELHVYPNGKRDEDIGNVSFFLRQVGLHGTSEPIMTEFQIYAMVQPATRTNVCKDTKDFTNQQGRGKFQVARDKMIQSLRTDGSLLLVCEVEYLPPGSNFSVESTLEIEAIDETDEDDYKDSVQTNLKDMFDNELFTDCVIIVGSKQFKAHRCILAQHSQVFRRMFAQDTMIESQNGKIDITDSRHEAVKALLQFIYTGETIGIENFAEDVLTIADKYAIFPLKEHCEKLLKKCINVKNVTVMVVFADTHSADILKSECIRFISQRHSEILKSAEWKTLKREYNSLGTEILETVVETSSQSFDESSPRSKIMTEYAGSLNHASASSSSLERTTVSINSQRHRLAIRNLEDVDSAELDYPSRKRRRQVFRE
uniref:BTB domain-containing protein n=1 Tax=Rhabditophanes sp. KR3021 TaxID=114890 RepID=A0AC35TH87_9BILA